MTCGLVHDSYSLPEWQAVKLTFFAPCLFYITCVRSVIDYTAPVFHHALPACLSQELERVQKRAMRIICPGIEYLQALAFMSLPTVAEHHICTRTFGCIMSDSNHKLRRLLPPLYKSNYNLRHARTFTLPRCKTNRFKVVEHSFGSLWVCHLPNDGKRKVAAHELKLGKGKIYWWKILIDR